VKIVQMDDISPQSIAKRVSDAAFGKPLVENSLRSLVVEAIVHLALGADWNWCGADWAGWDLEHRGDKIRLEVKQSAARQTWAPPKSQPRPVFDIAARKGYWVGSSWVAELGRLAHIYVFAFNPVTSEAADHRDPLQWDFYVVPAASLPDQKGLSLSRLKALVAPVGFSGLSTTVEAFRARIGCSDTPDFRKRYVAVPSGRHEHA
jgi:hypothetical protein